MLPETAGSSASTTNNEQNAGSEVQREDGARADSPSYPPAASTSIVARPEPASSSEQDMPASASQDGPHPVASPAISISTPAAAANDEAPTPASAMTPAMQMRLGLTRRLWAGVHQLTKRSRVLLVLQAVYNLAQIAAFVVVLALSAKDPCDKPLRIYLALHVVKLAIHLPLTFYITLAPPARPARGEQDSEESRARREARRVMGSPALDARVRSLSDLISLFAIVWFCLGNVWTYSAGTCRATSPKLWYSSLVTLTLVYLRIAEILFIILAVIFFLPAVIFVLRRFGGLEKKHEIGPLTKDEIASIPVVYYVPAPKQDENAAEASEAGIEKDKSTVGDVSKAGAPQAGTAPRKGRLSRLLFGRKRQRGAGAPQASGSNAPYIDTPHPLYPLPDNLSSCPICLADYEPPPLLTASADEQKQGLKDLEELNLLPCKHAIHKECLAPWLQTSGRCPVCQKGIRDEKDTKGKKGRRVTVSAGASDAPGTTPAPQTATV